MGRAYLVFILFAGMFGCMMSVGMSGVSSSRDSSARYASGGSDSSKSSSEDEDEDDGSEDGTIEIERSWDGHFYADVDINGATVRALIDTGATSIALSREDARSAGLATSIGMPSVVGQGADGDVHGEYVTLDRVTLGHKSAESVQAVVLNAGDQTLLGQSFLSEFDSVEIRGDTMVLR